MPENTAPKFEFFSKEQLLELDKFFNLTVFQQNALRDSLQGETLKVRDGHVTKQSSVWWRGVSGPEQVIAGDHWGNIEAFPLYYQIQKPLVVKVVYKS